MVAEGKGGDLESRITNLSLLSFERKEFSKTIKKIKNAFNIEIRDTKQLATIKAKRMMNTVTEDFKKIFREEYHYIVEQYNQMRYQLFKNEKIVAQTEG